MGSNFDLSVSLYTNFSCHQRQEKLQKKRRLRGEGSCPRKSEHAAFSRPATSSPLKKPLSCRQSRQKGFIAFKKVKSLFQFRAVAVILMKLKALSRKRPFPKGKLW